MLHALLLVVAAAAIAYALYWFWTPVRESQSNPPATSYKHKFVDPASGKAHSFPSLFDGASKYLSVIVPAYNEEERLPIMMEETLGYLEKREKESKDFTYEIIVVSDGSKDRTGELVLGYSQKYGSDKVRLLDLKVNQGKGGAVQQGMLNARGKYLLMVDADGATEFADFDKVEKELLRVEKDGHGIAVGSRAHLQEESVAKRELHRTILMHGFHFAVYLLAVRTVKDTQCGFKLFTRRTAQHVFFNQQLRRWCFDAEVLHMAEVLHIPIAEVGVRWEEIPGSKLRILDTSLKMGRDLLVIFLCYGVGIWQILDPGKKDK